MKLLIWLSPVIKRGEEGEILRCVQFKNAELTAKEAIEAPML